jgi:hypothetical protein
MTSVYTYDLLQAASRMGVCKDRTSTGPKREHRWKRGEESNLEEEMNEEWISDVRSRMGIVTLRR